MSSSEPDLDRPTPDASERRLVRTRRGRLIGGVCSGLGAHFGVDPILLRIAFVGVTFFGGIGIWLYLAVLLLVPEEGASRPPIRLRLSSVWTILGIAALVTAVAIAVPAASHAALGSGWAFGVGVGVIALLGMLASLLWARLRSRGRGPVPMSADLRLVRNLALGTAVVCGLALLALAGAWIAGVEPSLAAWAVAILGAALVLSAFTRGHRLVVPALAFALPVAIVAAAHVDLHGGLGTRVYRPRSVAELSRGYELGAGRLEVDLRGITFPAGDTALHVRLGAGELVVLVPDEVCVATRARIGGGYVGALDRQSGGLDVAWVNRPVPPPGVPRLLLEGQVGLGALFVADRPLAGGFQVGAYGTNEACRRRAGARP